MAYTLSHRLLFRGGPSNTERKKRMLTKTAKTSTMLSLGVAALALVASSARADFLISITEGPEGTLSFSSTDPSVPASSFSYGVHTGGGGEQYVVYSTVALAALTPTWATGHAPLLWSAEPENGLNENQLSLESGYPGGLLDILSDYPFGQPTSGTSVGYADAWTDRSGNAVDFMFNDVGAVPEPGTLIAGVLTLLPFGASTIRILRKRISA